MFISSSDFSFTEKNSNETSQQSPSNIVEDINNSRQIKDAQDPISLLNNFQIIDLLNAEETTVEANIPWIDPIANPY